MRDYYPVSKGAKIVLGAQVREQFNGRVIGSRYHFFRACRIGTLEVSTARVGDAIWFTHLYPDMGVVCGTTRVPTSMFPRKCLVNISRVRIDESVYTGLYVRGVPVPYEYGCGGLRTPHTM